MPNEWLFEQELYAIEEFDESRIKIYIDNWNNAISSTAAKGKLVWLYVNNSNFALE